MVLRKQNINAPSLIRLSDKTILSLIVFGTDKFEQILLRDRAKRW